MRKKKNEFKITCKNERTVHKIDQMWQIKNMHLWLTISSNIYVFNFSALYVFVYLCNNMNISILIINVLTDMFDFHFYFYFGLIKN